MIDVKKIGKLANISLSAEEEELYGRQFEQILEYFNIISKVNVENFEPLINPTAGPSYMRTDDPVKENFSVKEALANAPESMGNLFKVPPTV